MAERDPTVPQVVTSLELQIHETIETSSEMKRDTREQEIIVSRLSKTVKMPRYATCPTSIIVTGKNGTAPGELSGPAGVTIHEDTHHIFVANQINHRVEIFSETGDFLYQLGVGQLSYPYGIATHGDSVYVSCMIDDAVSKFSLTEMCCVRRIGSRGSNNDQFNFPHQLTTDTIGCVFTADFSNHRICVHDPDLNHLRNITHQSMSRPSDVKVSRERLYVLCPYDSPCMLVLTLEGDKLHSLITRGEGMDLLIPQFFCFNLLNNFVVSDCECHSIHVFSPEGNYLHTIGRKGHEQGIFYEPSGVAISPNGRLACASDQNYCLQILY